MSHEMDFYQLGMSTPTIEIPLTQGKVALIDVEDYERISKYKWFANKGGATWYAMAFIPDKGKHIRMHQFLLNPEKGKVCHHLDCNGLNNRECNLRAVTQSQNCINQRKTHGSSKYKGVYWFKSIKKWRSYIKINDKQQHLGYFINEEDAARAYDKVAKKYFGEYIRLNFPEEMK